MFEPSLNFGDRSPKPSGKLLLLIILSVSCMVLDSRYSAVQQLKEYAAIALQPLRWLAAQPVVAYEFADGILSSQSTLLKENKRLQQENLALQQKITQNHLQQQELHQLQSVHDLYNKIEQTGTVAQIVSNPIHLDMGKVIINKGSQAGLQAGDAVVDENGLLGQITKIQPFYAEVHLLSHAHSVIPVVVQRTGIRSLLYGSGNSTELRYFPLDGDLKIGDTLLTSGMNSVYPAGIPVAQVKSINHANGTPFQQVDTTPFAAMQKSRYVLVLPQQNQSSTFSDSSQSKQP